MTKQLILTLNEVEHGNIKGWLNWLRANPQFIGVSGKLEQVIPPGWTPTWQTRIVLEDQSKERFREILFCFTTEELGWDPHAFWNSYINGGVTPPPPSPVVLPPGCPVKLDIQAEFTAEERLNGQNVRVVQMWRDTVLVIPFRVPMPKNGVYFTRNDFIQFAICEFGSPPTMRQGTLSKTPGDFGKQTSEGGLLPDPSVIATGGLTPNMGFFVKDGWAKPGELVYANTRFWMIDYDTGKGRTTVQENQLDMAQQSRLSVSWPADNP